MSEPAALPRHQHDDHARHPRRALDLVHDHEHSHPPRPDQPSRPGSDHGHHHHHEHPPAPRADPPRLSLMALSAAQRVLLAAPVMGLLWLLTFWAMREG